MHGIILSTAFGCRAKISCRPDGAAFNNFLIRRLSFLNQALSRSSFYLPILSPLVRMLVVCYCSILSIPPKIGSSWWNSSLSSVITFSKYSRSRSRFIRLILYCHILQHYLLVYSPCYFLSPYRFLAKPHSLLLISHFMLLFLLLYVSWGFHPFLCLTTFYMPPSLLQSLSLHPYCTTSSPLFSLWLYDNTNHAQPKWVAISFNIPPSIAILKHN